MSGFYLVTASSSRGVLLSVSLPTLRLIAYKNICKAMGYLSKSVSCTFRRVHKNNTKRL